MTERTALKQLLAFQLEVLDRSTNNLSYARNQVVIVDLKDSLTQDSRTKFDAADQLG